MNTINAPSPAYWCATGDSEVCLVGAVGLENIDAEQGVTIMVRTGDGCTLARGRTVLPSGGVLEIR